MEQRHKAEMIRVLNTLLSGRTFDSRAVFLFGHCDATEEMADYLMAHDKTPVSIFDNNVAKWGRAYCDIPIITPERIQSYTADNSIVLIASRFFAEMSAQLRRLGYEGEIVQVVEYNSFAEYSLSDDTVECKTARMLRGVGTLKSIRARYPTQHIVICPNNALGDVYWAMAFLPLYCEKNDISETVIFIVGDACQQVSNMFNVANTAPLSQTEMDELVQAVIFTREENSIIAHHDRPYTDNIIKWLNRHFLSFIDYYRSAVYGLAKGASPILPSHFSQFENNEQIPKGKSVIVSPYAKSVINMPSVLWERIVADNLCQGSSVYTNVVGDEMPILGTLPLKVPISQMLAATEYAGTFIGIRSGLCDVLYSANCQKTVVFPDCCYSTTTHKVADFFALPGWNIIK
jgi:hypothetical protein